MQLSLKGCWFSVLLLLLLRILRNRYFFQGSQKPPKLTPKTQPHHPFRRQNHFAVIKCKIKWAHNCAFLNYCCSSSLGFYCLEYVFNSKWYLDELVFLKKSWCLWGNHVTKNYLREAGCCSARVCFHIFLHIILIVGLWMVLENAFLFLFFFLTLSKYQTLYILRSDFSS